MQVLDDSFDDNIMAVIGPPTKGQKIATSDDNESSNDSIQSK